MKQKLGFFFLILLVAICAYFFGVQASSFLNHFQAEKTKNENEEIRQAILERTQSFQKGNKLPNFFFYDLDGNQIELHKITMNSPSLVCYVTSDCHICTEQIELLKRLCTKHDLNAKVLVLSSSNPFELVKFKSDNKIDWPILYDHARQYGGNLKIQVFPFYIVVDSSFNILNVIPGKLEEREMLDIFAATNRDKTSDI